MAENKTKATDASVESYLDSIVDAERKKDCVALAAMMSKATQAPAIMWGSSIVGFGSYHYRYDSGREGDSCLIGFAARKGDISLYGLNAAPEHAALLAQLGKHKTGKACLYIRKLADVDLAVLEKLMIGAAQTTERAHC